MSARRRKNAIKRRQRAVRQLALVPLPPRPAEEALPLPGDQWPMLPRVAALPRATRPWRAVLQNHSVLYASIASLVGLVVLLILRWMETAEQVRPYLGEQPPG
jgi:hypothetical protein